MDIKSTLGRLRLVAILEGISYLLFAITMPLKYVYGLKDPNFYVGMTHGWLFVLYILLAFQNSFYYRWSFKTLLLVLIASLIPFATFIVDVKLLKPISVANNN